MYSSFFYVMVTGFCGMDCALLPLNLLLECMVRQNKPVLARHVGIYQSKGTGDKY